jgi:enoyl-CoA hydratase/carnithine racemase
MSPEPTTEFCTLTYPALHILLVTLNQPQKLNCLGLEDHYELSSVWEYLDNNDQLRVGIVAGEGRAFCGGADLKGKSLEYGLFPVFSYYCHIKYAT